MGTDVARQAPYTTVVGCEVGTDVARQAPYTTVVESVRWVQMLPYTTVVGCEVGTASTLHHCGRL